MVGLPGFACTLARPFKSDTQGKSATWNSRSCLGNWDQIKKISFSSQSLRMKIINLDLVSMPEIGRDLFSVSFRSLRLSVRNSRSRLDVRDWIREILILVSRMKKRLSLTSGSNELYGRWVATKLSAPCFDSFFIVRTEIDEKVNFLEYCSLADNF